MPPKRKRTKREEVRHYLSGGGVLREDSDDELEDADFARCDGHEVLQEALHCY